MSFTLLKIAALSTLLMHHLFLPFVVIAVISRLGLLILIRTYDFRSSFVSQLHTNLRLFPLVLVIGLFGALGFYLLSWNIFLLFGVGGLTAFLLSSFAKKGLGFINGDVLGMSLEGSELMLILTVLLVWY
ncbi:MAG: hypothetical protein A2552_01140 [Sulfuricurvum sp. RIFOXYD2_FULL_44_160]|nr:MAG: hypothetical protein A2552_01140 [Sulfuricurvum sp. RIFOXYD2_FULL_44_160]